MFGNQERLNNGNKAH
uniref:Calcutta-rstR-b n=1 Tax=Affertcholeramvirus CTXphi TaxID=141904 RepID=Q9MBU7_9VIRU|nr:Calcutta-rstR-b [Vibrio phage CTXphi]